MKVIGVDLSGPRNTADTYLVVLNEQGTELHLIDNVNGADDQQIFHTITGLGSYESIIIGIDAPLSYNPGGGDRTSDGDWRPAAHNDTYGISDPARYCVNTHAGNT